MIYFIYGEDSYRAKRKLYEIVDGYKKVHKSGLNLIYIDAKEESFGDFFSNFKISPMFAEKKLTILKNTFSDSGWQEDFLENIKSLEELKDIIVVYEDCSPDKRLKLFKVLQKYAKCQEFEKLAPANLRKWVAEEFGRAGSSARPDAADLLCSFVQNDLWRMASEIKKLSDYKNGGTVEKKDVELLVKPNIENDIFRTIDSLASGDKKQALSLLYKHLEAGDNPLYLLSMIAYQFRNLLIIKELSAGAPSGSGPSSGWQKKSGLHPFVIQKSSYLCSRFTMPKLKEVYHKVFQTDFDIKTGKIEPELALDLLLAEI